MGTMILSSEFKSTFKYTIKVALLKNISKPKDTLVCLFS